MAVVASKKVASACSIAGHSRLAASRRSRSPIG
jgi:hypothetical protein